LARDNPQIASLSCGERSKNLPVCFQNVSKYIECECWLRNS
jgi:hypothetical protein